MSQLELLPARSALDFSLADTDEYHPLDAKSPLISDLLSSPSLRITASSSPSPFTGEDIFPTLPPLYHGHPDLHLRRGIMRATADAHEPDAERAFFVADLSEVYKQHMRWVRCLPGVVPFYAVKCNPDPYILRLLSALGTGFDCASNNEIAAVLALGGTPASNVIFANPCKATSFIRNAARQGVDTMTFDNADELYKIKKAHPGARCVVRILTDDSKSLCAFGIKFGASLAAVPGLLATAKELGLNVVGVSFHVGSGCYDPTVYLDAISRARRVFDMAAAMGFNFTLLDVGGGFEDKLFEQAAEVLRGAIEQYFPEEERRERGVKVIAEPGRFYVATAMRLGVCVIARRAPLGVEGGEVKKEEEGEEKAPEVMYYINDGVYGAFNCILFDHQSPLPSVLSLRGSFHVPPSEPTHTASVWGPTCDSIDCVARRAVLPKGLTVGDWLGFENMGAYTVCAASGFNGFEVSRVVYTAGTGEVGEQVGRVLRGYAREGWGNA